MTTYGVKGASHGVPCEATAERLSSCEGPCNQLSRISGSWIQRVVPIYIYKESHRNNGSPFSSRVQSDEEAVAMRLSCWGPT
ncbi:hypothetical protein SUGI_0506840 [Cryptomeria japonica]|nr:hypothetical protein SUGI_0506840 [Cryptomeria japonica]